MLHFLLVRIYFYWLVFYTDTSGTSSSARVGWLGSAVLKLQKGAWLGSLGKVPQPGIPQQHKNEFAVGSEILILMKSPTWSERVCTSLPLPHGSVLRIDSFWMRINARKQNIWLPSSSRLPEWEAVNWHFGVMILISAEHSKMEQAQLFLQSETNLKKSLNYFFWRKQCSQLYLYHFDAANKEVCWMKSKMWLNTVDCVCTKMRKVFDQAVLDFGYFTWRKSSPGLLHAESVWITCVLWPLSCLSLPSAFSPPWHPKQQSAMLAERAWP